MSPSPEWMDRQVTNSLKNVRFWMKQKGHALTEEQRKLLAEIGEEAVRQRRKNA
jgi:hypothetical protein